MVSGDSDQDAEYALSKLLPISTVAEYQNEFEILINRVTGISQYLLKLLYIFGLKLELQRKLLSTRPTILGEAISLARITEARYEDEQPTIAIAKPNDLTTRVQVQDLEQTTQGQGDKPNRFCWLRFITCYTLLLWKFYIKSSLLMIDNTKPPLSVDTFGNNRGDDSENSNPVTSAEEVVDSRHSSTLSSSVEHESLRVLQLKERIGIGEVHELIDNEGNHNFVQPNAEDRMCLQAMVMGRSYQGFGGSWEEATWEWMPNSQSAYSLYHLEGKIQRRI
uniref:Uncharacterized protein n=1 Tax=Tanacetum cinerariifolium TaxID=118510 RepID=A0A699INH2_TANCI|nr:hypothetical protein [Tanacetum cinerariifolium]